ncbi:speckle targeted PIP5K1A-regulated poly(A) polymerase isoform 1-T3 [Aphomia sociella]
MEAGRGAQGRAPNAPDNTCLVHVSGYPGYTQPQDLIRIFANIGKVTVEKINHKFAILMFSNPIDAKCAIQASMKKSVYGAVLTVKPYNEKQVAEMTKKQKNNKRDFTRSKQKGVIVDPKDIDLSGDFLHQVDNILCMVRLTQEEVFKISSLYSDVEHVLQEEWPGCTAIPFGSIPTGLGIKTSDADCFVKVPPQYRRHNINFVQQAARILRQYPDVFDEILPIPRANTPIVKFFHIPTGTNCDLTFKTELGARNSSLISFFLRADPRLIPIAVLIKYWAKVHDISGSGKITNYALIMLIIFYLQQPNIAILPSIRRLQQDPRDDYIVDDWNTGFMNRLESLPPITNRSTISELLGGFFEYYATFNFDEMIVCPYLGYPVKKELFKDLNNLPEGFERYKDNIINKKMMGLRFNTSWCVQDPFEQCHNVASPISSRYANDYKSYLNFVADTYVEDKINKCEKFLRIILLQKPKLAKEKAHIEFRSNLFPKLISNIKDPDWKSVVREIVFTIFETMLKIKLGKVEEKVNPDTKKEKEKYMGIIMKPIWKRKNASKLYSMMNMDLLQKQTKITEDVLKTEKTQINIQFQMMLTYCHDPKRAMVSIKFNHGDIATFKEFGKFFVSILQNWFTQLLTPYAKNTQIDTAAKIAETIKFLDSNLDSTNIPSDDDSDNESDQLSRKAEVEPQHSDVELVQ